MITAFQGTTADSISITLAEPAVPNGRIENFLVYLNNTLVRSLVLFFLVDALNCSRKRLNLEMMFDK